MFLVLGAGISGLATAVILAEHGHKVILLDKQKHVGGLAASQDCFGIPVDLGSHRIHPEYHPAAMKLVKELIPNDLVQQKRNGKIWILSRYIKYPPNMFSLLAGFGITQCLIWGKDLLISRLRKKTKVDNFKNYTVSKIGYGLFRDFYEPYAKKLWNLETDKIAIDPAIHRVRRLSLKQAISKFMSAVFSSAHGQYYYPKNGIGQIADALKDRFINAGGELLLESQLLELELDDAKNIKSVTIKNQNSSEQRIQIDNVISTLPLKFTHKLLSRKLGNQEISKLKYRALRLIYLQIDELSDSDSETYYVPDLAYQIGRVSEVSKYSKMKLDFRVLTVEIPCTQGDSIWSADEKTLLDICKKELPELGIINKPDNIKQMKTVVVPEVYPVYDLSWKEDFNESMKLINQVNNLFHFGRTALFLHCNIDHCIYMGQETAKFILEKKPRSEWEKLQESFLEFNVRE